jgi:aminoglycoside phosphotransferase (APT) family kinase protein
LSSTVSVRFPAAGWVPSPHVESPKVRAAPEVRTALRSLLPEFADAPLRPAGAGDCYEAWWVADRYIVRFAKGDAEHDASETLAVEMALLPTLAEVIDVQIPRPIRLGQDPATGRSVLVHEAVLGTPLLPAVWEDLSPAQRRAVAADVGRFVIQLQAVSIESASIQLPETRFHAVHHQPEAIERFVFNRMSASDVEVCRTLAREFDPCPPNRWVFVHGDLYNHHLLVAEDASLAGVIDFGDLGRGDPACDLGTLMDDFGVEFVSATFRPSSCRSDSSAHASTACGKLSPGRPRNWKPDPSKAWPSTCVALGSWPERSCADTTSHRTLWGRSPRSMPTPRDGPPVP